ncbi:MAG: glycosyltransferase family 39 protein [Deltaproteobacteria bacterium]|nr:glycosyltransferase family 39 protein [Deltaproteobacteria bacterium]
MNRFLRSLLARRELAAWLLLSAFVCAIYLPRLGSYAFWDPWEPHYAQVAKEMADHGSWMDTWYRGQNRWWSKPILPLWLLRLSFSCFGVDTPDHPWLHFAGRLPIFLLALIGVLLTYRWVARLYDRRAGVYSSLVLATSPMYALLAHQIMFDMLFVAFCAAAVGHYFLARSDKGRPIDLILFFVLTALAFLSKWLLALFIPAGIFIIYIALRWDLPLFRRVGGWYWLGGGLVLSACTGWFFLSQSDLAFAGMLSVCVLALLLIFWMGRDAAVTACFKPRVLWIGLGLLLLLILPWHIYMMVKHGWAFVREAVIYHHFDRAAGTIGKPEGTFDVYIKQLAFASFPWIALLPAAFVKWLRWGREDLEGRGQRDLWVLLSALVPFSAFSLFQTKFHHYIFPVLPFVAVMLGVFLARMHAASERAWMRLCVMLALPISAVLLADILHDYKWFIHLFDYYYGWPLPASLDPYPAFAVLGGLWGLVLALLFFRRRIGTWIFATMTALAASVCLLLTAYILPAVTPTFTQEPIYRAYVEASGGEAPVAQYNGWLSRSVSFYFDNRAEDLSKSDQPNAEKAIQFLRRPQRSFLILGAGFGRDGKALLAELRPKVRRELGKSLYAIYDQHPFSMLVSTERDPRGAQKLKEMILESLPEGADIRRMSVDFKGRIELVGYRTSPPAVRPGDAFTVSYYFKCTAPVGEDWLVFIHGDGPQGGAHRVFGDHAPVGGLYPTSEWQPGQIIQDDYRMEVPSNYPYKGFTLWMGFWKGERRLEVAKRHQHDGNNRVRTAYIKVE